jgi:hypothetical protein
MSSASDFDRMILDFFRDDPATAYYQKSSLGTYDPATGEVASTLIEVPVQIILLDLTRNSNGLSSKFGTEILSGDKECYILPPEKADPLALPLVIDTTADRIRIGSIVYKVFRMQEANPTGASPLLYNLMLRR